MKYSKVLIMILSIFLLITGCESSNNVHPIIEDKNDLLTQNNEITNQQSTTPNLSNENIDIFPSPLKDTTKYLNNKGVEYLIAFTNLIKNRQYKTAITYFTKDMIIEVEKYGYSDTETYLQETFQDTNKDEIQLILYEVNEDNIVSAISRKDGETPFSAYLKSGVWLLRFSPLN